MRLMKGLGKVNENVRVAYEQVQLGRQTVNNQSNHNAKDKLELK